MQSGSIQHLETGVTLYLPAINNGTIVVDTEMYNMNVNDVDVLEFEGDFFELTSGENGFLFKAEQASARVRFEWEHRFV